MAHHETCPVSGLIVNNLDASLYFEYEGMRLYFCCSSCEDNFLREPDYYLSGNGSFYSFPT